MSEGSTTANSLELADRLEFSRAALAAFGRLRRKASVVILGCGLVFVGMAIAITDADQTNFQKAAGLAGFVLLLLLVFFAWHIRKDADNWNRLLLGRSVDLSQRLEDQREDESEPSLLA